jgi:hypothetical protein
MDHLRTGKPDRNFLERCFQRLYINFVWWVSRVDREGNSVFEGGFIGLDNIITLDRSERLPGGTVLEQADATGWMGMFCLNLMRIALELARENPVYEGMAIKFFQHFVYVAQAMNHMGNRNYQLWDKNDGFFYDVIRYPNGDFHKFRVRSWVGLIPLFAVECLEEEWMSRFKEFTGSFRWFINIKKDLVKGVVREVDHSGKKTWVLTIVDENQIQALLKRMWDEKEFLSPYGVRSLSKAHEHPHEFWFMGRSVGYEPAEAVSKIKGGNDNWRGPIWFPTSFLLIESLHKLARAYGPEDGILARGSGDSSLTFRAMAGELAERLIRLFTRDRNTGLRPVYGGSAKFQEDPHWKDYLLFYEYFHGDNGTGLGASHHTGWTALVATLIDEWRR